MNPPELTKTSIVDNASVMNDEALQQHLVRMQKVLVKNVDQELNEMSENLSNTALDLKRAQDDKVAVGTALYYANTKIGWMNQQLESLKSQNEMLKNTQLMTTEQHGETEKKLKLAMIDLNEKQAELLMTRRYLEDSNVKIKQLTEINASYTSDLKMQHRVKGKLSKELQVSELQKKKALETVQETKKAKDMLANKNAEMELLNGKQRTETIVAQKAVDCMAKEIADLANTKRAMEKQWEESIYAMSKRDISLQAIQNSKEKLGIKLSELERELHSVKTQRDQAISKLNAKEIDFQTLTDSYTTLKSNKINADKELSKIQDELCESYTSQSHLKMKLKAIEQKAENLVAECEAKSKKVSSLQDQVTDGNNKLFMREKEKESMEQFIKTEEKDYIKRQKNEQTIHRDEDNKNSKLQNSHVNLKLKHQEQMEILNDTIKDRDDLQQKYNELNQHYIELYDESKYMTYSLERKQHDINHLQTKLSKAEDESDDLQGMEVRRLQTDLIDAKKENEKVQKMWITERDSHLKMKDLLEKVQSENDFIKTKYAITDIVKNKTHDEMTASKKEAIDNKLESSRLYIQLKKMLPALEELRQKNITLEQQLVEAKSNADSGNINTITTAHMLKSEIRKLYKDRNTGRMNLLASEKGNSTIERKYILAKEMLEKLQVDKKALLKENFNLKKKAKMLDSTHSEEKIAHSYFDKLKVPTIANQNGTSTPRSHLTHTWESLLFSGSNNKVPTHPNASLITHESAAPSAESVTKAPLNEVPDFESWRLKLESLTTEREFLQNENNLLKSRIRDLSSKLVSMEKKSNESQKSNEKLLKDLEKKKQEMEESLRKSERAEKIAASLERQFRELKPNTTIDYYLLGDVTPSTQLLAALMAQPPPKRRDSILPTLLRMSSFQRKQSQSNQNSSLLGQMH